MAEREADGASLRRNFSWTLLGNLVFHASQYGLLVIIAKRGTPEALGQFAFASALASPVLQFLNLQLSVVQATDVTRETRFSTYFMLRLLTTALGLAVIAAVGVLAADSSSTLAIVLAVGAMKAAESLSDLCYGLFQQRERMARTSTSLILRGILSAAAFLVALPHGGLGMAALAAAGAWLLVFLFHDWPSVSGILGAAPPPPVQGSSSSLRTLLAVALPLGVVSLLLALNPNIPRYFIEHSLGPRSLGYYAAAGSLTAPGLLIVASLTQPAAARLARAHHEDDRRAFVHLLSRLVGVAAAIGMAGVALSVVAGRPILTLLYRSDYGDYASVMTWAMIAGAFGCIGSALGQGMSSARKFRIQTVVLTASVAAGAAACLLLVPRNGLEGAAQSWSIAMAIFMLGGIVVNGSIVRNLSAR